MAHKRKPHGSVEVQKKRLKISKDLFNSSEPLKHQLLNLYYYKILTLRDYILSQSLSKRCRRRITALNARVDPSLIFSTFRLNGPSNTVVCRDDDHRLALVLETTLVGVRSQHYNATDGPKSQDFTAFSQQTSSCGSMRDSGLFSQSKVS